MDSQCCFRRTSGRASSVGIYPSIASDGLVPLTSLVLTSRVVALIAKALQIVDVVDVNCRKVLRLATKAWLLDPRDYKDLRTAKLYMMAALSSTQGPCLYSRPDGTSGVPICRAMRSWSIPRTSMPSLSKMALLYWLGWPGDDVQ